MQDPSIPYKQMEGREILLRQVYDCFLRIFDPEIICDIGAFDGDETVRFSQICPDANLFAFEANRKNIDQFWSEKVANVPNLKLEYMAVTDRNGTIDFNILDTDDNQSDWRRGGSSILQRNDSLTYKTETVNCTTLDDYFERHGLIDKRFVLWIDVEGGLDGVLRGATKVLKRTHMLRAEVEHKELWKDQVLAPENKQYLIQQGFIEAGDTFLPEGYDQSDIIMVKKALG